jgi:hypothetical protein
MIYVRAILKVLKAKRKKEKFSLKHLWLIFYIKNFSPSEFVKDQIYKILTIPRIAIVENKENIKPTEDNRGFFYIGHGDEECVYRAKGFVFGLRNPLCNLSELETWNFHPYIFWACSSSIWLTKWEKKSWLGFKNYIGYDCRNKNERKWWKNHLKSVLYAVFSVGEGAREQSNILETTKKGYDRAKILYHRKKISYLSVLLSAALHDEIEMGKDFGKLE